MQKKSITNRKKGEKAITLITLVITVIILLILAGTAISIGLNEGELFGHTNNSVERYNEKVAEMETSLTNAMEMLDKAANPDLAKYKLEVKVNYDEEGNETAAESPYYVWYPSDKYIEENGGEENCKGIKCRVLYNDSIYGLQLISVNPVAKVDLGGNDQSSLEKVAGDMGSIERSKNSYNRAITTLNENTETYIDKSGIAKDARCVGSNPLNKNYPENLEEHEKQEEILLITEEHNNNSIGEYYKTDTHYEIDYNRLNKIGARIITDDLAVDKTYWLASHYVEYSDSYYADAFCIRYVPNDSEVSFRGLIYIYHRNQFAMQGGGKMGLRPVFILADNAIITGGQGTEEDPFELGL